MKEHGCKVLPLLSSNLSGQTLAQPIALFCWADHQRKFTDAKKERFMKLRKRAPVSSSKAIKAGAEAMAPSDTEPDADEQIVEILRRATERKKKAPNISVKMVNGTARLTVGEKSDPDERLKLMAALGTYDLDFLSPLISQISNSVSEKNEVQESSVQFAIGFIKSIDPQNEIETLLAAQMAAVHVCAMDSSRRYLWAETLQSKDSAERAMTKLTRTFTVQMEALKRHRAKAQQTVRVERVNVESGGQAVVGDVSTGGGEHEK